MRTKSVIAYFSHRNIRYTVSGWLWSPDGAENGLIIRREDGQPVEGAQMHPGQVQTGVPEVLERAAARALASARGRS